MKSLGVGEGKEGVGDEESDAIHDADHREQAAERGGGGGGSGGGAFCGGGGGGGDRNRF